MFDPTDETAREQLFLDLDTRLLSIWVEAVTDLPWTYEAVVSYFRICYAAGYMDSLREPARGQLLRDHGLDVPRRARRR